MSIIIQIIAVIICILKRLFYTATEYQCHRECMLKRIRHSIGMMEKLLEFSIVIFNNTQKDVWFRARVDKI